MAYCFQLAKLRKIPQSIAGQFIFRAKTEIASKVLALISQILSLRVVTLFLQFRETI